MQSRREFSFVVVTVTGSKVVKNNHHTVKKRCAVEPLPVPVYVRVRCASRSRNWSWCRFCTWGTIPETIDVGLRTDSTNTMNNAQLER
jgi:hypothetical protein